MNKLQFCNSSFTLENKFGNEEACSLISNDVGGNMRIHGESMNMLRIHFYFDNQIIHPTALLRKHGIHENITWHVKMSHMLFFQIQERLT